jgi:hypothetical protein
MLDESLAISAELASTLLLGVSWRTDAEPESDVGNGLLRSPLNAIRTVSQTATRATSRESRPPGPRRPVKVRWNQRFPIGDDSFRTNLSIFPIPVRLICRTSSGLDIWRNQEEALRYTLLIHLDERAMEGKSPEEMAPVLDAWYQYTSALQSSKTWLAGEALQPTSTATTVRVQGDRTIVTDGPYAETKEQLGGFYMIEAENLDQAIEWAAKMPHMAGGGAVEVRPVMEVPDH